MVDETIYKRNDKGKKISKETKTSITRVRFKDHDINISKTITIGRDAGNDISIPDDPLVSRRHAIIEKTGKFYFLTDKGSVNGTYVNKNPIKSGEKIQLFNGDEILVGKTKLSIL